MTIERALRLAAGTFILLTLGLAQVHSPYWLWFTAFVGLNLFQSGITNWCPPMWLFGKLGLPSCEKPAQSDLEDLQRP